MLSTISAFSAAATFWSAYILPGPLWAAHQVNVGSKQGSRPIQINTGKEVITDNLLTKIYQ